MKRIWLVTVLTAMILALAAAPAMAQPVVPSKSGLVSYIMGSVYLDNVQLPDPIVVQNNFIKEKGSLRTEEGRAEILMNPGLAMRVGENSEVRMISSRLIDTRVELVKGSAVVQLVEEFTDLRKDNSFTLVLKDATITLAKVGDYRFDAEPARIKVFAGLANVQIENQTVAVSTGKMLDLGGGSASVERFDVKQTDALDRWSGQLGELAARANASSARQVNDQYGTKDPCYGYRSSAVPVGTNPCVGTWRWNPWYGMWTYIRYGGVYCDPMWGYCYYNPRDVMNAYYRPPVYYNPMPGWGGGGGYSGAPATYSGSSGAAASSGVAVSAPSAGSGSTAAAAASSSAAGHGSSGGSGK